MYPLIELGPIRLSSGGLLLLLSMLAAQWLLLRAARAAGNAALAEQAERCFYPALAGAAIGARLWYGAFNWSLYSQTPSLFVAPRLGDLAWPGALLGGALAGALWCRWRRIDPLGLADCAALALPPAQALASVGLLLSGEAFGVPTGLPWGVPLFGATRHPTQLYFALAALVSFGVLRRMAKRRPPPGTLTTIYLALQGLTLLLVEALRADSLLLPAGVRAGQVFGLLLVLLALLWMRQSTARRPEGPSRMTRTDGERGDEISPATEVTQAMEILAEIAAALCAGVCCGEAWLLSHHQRAGVEPGLSHDGFACDRTNLKRRRVLQVLLHRALLGRANHGRAILLRKIGRQLDVEPHQPDHAAVWVRLNLLHQP